MVLLARFWQLPDQNQGNDTFTLRLKVGSINLVEYWLAILYSAAVLSGNLVLIVP
jgi:hypothetical protein